MWGALTSLAAAAAEQVQQEAASIRADMQEVTQHGFDLLDQLDKKLDAGQDSDASASDEFQDDAVPGASADESTSGRSTGVGDADDSAGSIGKVQTETTRSPSHEMNIAADLGAVGMALGLSEVSTENELVKKASLIVRENKMLSKKLKKAAADISMHRKESETTTKNLRQQQEFAQRLAAEIDLLNLAAEKNREQIDYLLQSQQQWEGDNEKLLQDLKGSEATCDNLRQELASAVALASLGDDRDAKYAVEKAVWESERKELNERTSAFAKEVESLRAESAGRLSAEALLSEQRVRVESDLNAEIYRLHTELAAATATEESTGDFSADTIPKSQYEYDLNGKQQEIDVALLRIDDLMIENIALTKTVEEQTIQLIAAEEEKSILQSTKKSLKDASKRMESLAAELNTVNQKLSESKKAFQSKVEENDQLNHEVQSYKAKIVVLKEHEKSLLKRHAEELSSASGISESTKNEIDSLKAEILALLGDKSEREELYAGTVKSLDIALAQIHELSIATHHHGGEETNDLLVGNAVGSGRSPIPRTPLSDKTTPNGDESFFSPDEGSFKTPGMGPKTGGTTKSKKSTKPKSKSEMVKEIQGLIKQLQDLRSMHGSMTSQFKESIMEMNEEMANSVLTAASMAASSPLQLPHIPNVVSNNVSVVDESESSTAELKENVQILTSKVSALEIANNKLESELAAALVLSHEKAIVAVEHDIAIIEERTMFKEECDAKLNKLRLQVLSLAESNKQLEDSVIGLKDEASANERNLDGNFAVISILEGAKSNLEDDARILRNKIKILEDAALVAKADIVEKNCEIDSLERQLELLQGKVVALTSKKDDYCEALKERDSKIVSLESEVSMLKEEKNTCQSDTDGINEVISKLRTELAASKTACEALKEELSMVKGQLLSDLYAMSHLKETITALESEKEKFQELLSAHHQSGEREELDTAISDLMAQVASEEARAVAELESKCNSLLDEEYRLRAQIDGLATTRHDFKAALNLIQAELSEAKDQLSSERTRATEAVRQLEAIVGENNDTKQKLSVLEMEKERLLEQVDAHRNENDQKAVLQTALSDMKTELEKQKDRVDSAESQVEIVTTIARAEVADIENEMLRYKMEAAAREEQLHETQRILNEEISELKAECIRRDGELTRRVVDDASMRETSRELVESNNKLFREIEVLKNYIAEVSSSHEKVVESLSVEAEEFKAASLSAEEIIASQKLSIEHLAARLSESCGEVQSLRKRLDEIENVAVEADSLRQELLSAKLKLSKIEEKKKREFENLKKQNELISRLQREKESIDRAHDQVVFGLKEEVDKYRVEVEALRNSLAEKEEVFMDLEDKYLFMQESNKVEAELGRTTVDELLGDSAATPCKQCEKLNENVIALMTTHTAEVQKFIGKIEILEKEKNSYMSEVTEMIEARADWIAKLSAAEKELSRLRMCEKGLESKVEEVQYFEQEVTKLRAIGKEKDLLVADKERELLAVQDELRELQYREKKQLAEELPPSTPIAVSTVDDVESGLGASTRNSAKKTALTSSGLALLDRAEDEKGKDEFDGVSQWVLALWTWLRERFPSGLASLPPLVQSPQQENLLQLCYNFI